MSTIEEALLQLILPEGILDCFEVSDFYFFVGKSTVLITIKIITRVINSENA